MDILPVYVPPDFSRPALVHAPSARVEPAPADGVLPDRFHATSNFPEYVHVGEQQWVLARDCRMDGVIVRHGNAFVIIEPRRVRKGELVVVGRSQNGEDGIYVHAGGFSHHEAIPEAFAFRTRCSRETPYSRSYDRLYEILRHDRDNGRIVWVLGPAVVFDHDSREAMSLLIKAGYCHALLAGNALATHDLEAALYGTCLGQDIYTQELIPGGHCHHLDAINQVRRCGSIPAALSTLVIHDGILAACHLSDVPVVLAGSIRDDGPLPGVISDACHAQDAMRCHARTATVVLGLATQLHTIAFGNMLPGYQLERSGAVRPVFFFVVDMSEFGVDKLSNRGSLQAVPILTNVQDFLVNLRHNLL